MQQQQAGWVYNKLTSVKFEFHFVFVMYYGNCRAVASPETNSIQTLYLRIRIIYMYMNIYFLGNDRWERSAADLFEGSHSDAYGF